MRPTIQEKKLRETHLKPPRANRKSVFPEERPAGSFRGPSSFPETTRSEAHDFVLLHNHNSLERQKTEGAQKNERAVDLRDGESEKESVRRAALKRPQGSEQKDFAAVFPRPGRLPACSILSCSIDRRKPRPIVLHGNRGILLEKPLLTTKFYRIQGKINDKFALYHSALCLSSLLPNKL